MSQPFATRTALLRLLTAGGWHSGAELAHRLGISRAAVWKQIRALDAWDIGVVSERRRGYRLAEAIDLLDADRLRAAFAPPATAMTSVDVFDSVPSTNAHLVARIASGQGEGVCLAEHQTAGRGRRGRAWHSPFGRNLYLSISRAYDAGPARLAGLSIAVGAAVVRLLREAGVADVGIKWPNDLVVDGRKLGGILIELQGDTHGPCWAVTGVGVNVNMRAATDGAIDQPWISLAQITGRLWDRTDLAVRLVRAVQGAMAGFPGAGLEPWLADYAAADVLAGRVVDVDWAGERISGIARGIDANGALLLDCDGVRRPLWGGEVTIRARHGSAA